MPHLILEYSDNLEFDIQDFFRELHESLVETGAVNLKGLKSRAIKLTDYRIADGKPEYMMAHLTIILREGRPRKVKEDVAQRMLAQLDKTFGHYREHGYIGLSTNMQELQTGIALLKNNLTPEVVAMDSLS